MSQRFNRKFLQESYDKCDAPAKLAVGNHFKRIGCEIVWDNERFNMGDICVRFPNGETTIFEIENRNHYYTNRIPFSTVHVPFRKKHNTAEVYIVIGKDFKYFWTCKMDDVKSSPVMSMFVNDMTEYFFDVPKKYWTRIEVLN